MIILFLLIIVVLLFTGAVGYLLFNKDNNLNSINNTIVDDSSKYIDDETFKFAIDLIKFLIEFLNSSLLINNVANSVAIVPIITNDFGNNFINCPNICERGINFINFILYFTIINFFLRFFIIKK